MPISSSMAVHNSSPSFWTYSCTKWSSYCWRLLNTSFFMLSKHRTVFSYNVYILLSMFVLSLFIYLERVFVWDGVEWADFLYRVCRMLCSYFWRDRSYVSCFYYLVWYFESKPAEAKDFTPFLILSALTIVLLTA